MLICVHQYTIILIDAPKCMVNRIHINDNERRKNILRFVCENQGCKKQSVVNYFDPNATPHLNFEGSQLNISKKTIYRIINELVNDDLLREEKGLTVEIYCYMQIPQIS